MLVLTRKPKESIVIGDDIEITIVEIRGDQVRIGIEAPRSLAVFRKEIYVDIRDANERAAASAERNVSTLGSLIKGLLGERKQQ